VKTEIGKLKVKIESEQQAELATNKSSRAALALDLQLSTVD
jgi:hypothetical protein